MCWFKKNVGKIKMTEMSTAEKLHEFRAQNEGFTDESFTTISAYGANAAMCHYSPSYENDTVIEPKGLYLVDSGGQYYEGTTDVTRTWACGELTDSHTTLRIVVDGDGSFLVLIAGGRDKTDNQDLPDLARLFTATPNLRHLVLIGESGRALAPLLPTELYTLAPDLQSAVSLARQHAEALVAPAVTPIVLMSPAAASFDMFQNVYDRGAKFQNLVNSF